MAWYFCENDHETVFLQHPSEAPRCTTCRGATHAVEGSVRLRVDDDAGAYTLQWKDDGEAINWELVTTVSQRQYTVAISNAMLAYHTDNLSRDTAISPPGGGRWVDAGIRTHTGGRPPGRGAPAVSQSLANPQLRLGRHTGAGGDHGLIHILHRHANVFNNMRARPDNRFDLSALRDNLRSITGDPTGRGTGARRIVHQNTNNRDGVHGVAGGQHAMLIVDTVKIITCFTSQNLSGMGQNPTTIRRW